MPRMLAALLLACIVVSSASAQIIYEPVRYQYGGQTPWYYGGNDPEMFRFADRDHSEAHDGFFAARGNYMTHHEVNYRLPRVYADHMQRTNAATYGYTPDDARNEAYRNAPRYFRKRDLLNCAVQDVDGAWHVPAQISNVEPSGTMEIKPYVRPVVVPKRVIIIPKDLLDKKIEEPKKVASAN